MRGNAGPKILILLTAVFCSAAAMAAGGDSGLEPLELHLPLAATSGGTGLSEAGPIVLDSSRFVRSLETRSEFYDGYLLPRMNSIIGDLSPAHDTRIIGLNDGYDGATAALQGLTHHGFQRAAKKAFRSYVLTSSGLEKRADVYREAHPLETVGWESCDGAVELKLGAAHALPRLDFNYRVGDSSQVLFSLRGTGEVRMEYDRTGSSRTWVYAGYDFRHRQFDTRLRVAF